MIYFQENDLRASALFKNRVDVERGEGEKWVGRFLASRLLLLNISHHEPKEGKPSFR